jgi:hypothetical protein
MWHKPIVDLQAVEDFGAKRNRRMIAGMDSSGCPIDVTACH